MKNIIYFATNQSIDIFDKKETKLLFQNINYQNTITNIYATKIIEKDLIEFENEFDNNHIESNKGQEVRIEYVRTLINKVSGKELQFEEIDNMMEKFKLKDDSSSNNNSTLSIQEEFVKSKTDAFIEEFGIDNGGKKHFLVGLRKHIIALENIDYSYLDELCQKKSKSLDEIFDGAEIEMIIDMAQKIQEILPISQEQKDKMIDEKVASNTSTNLDIKTKRQTRKISKVNENQLEFDFGDDDINLTKKSSKNLKNK